MCMSTQEALRLLKLLRMDPSLADQLTEQEVQELETMVHTKGSTL